MEKTTKDHLIDTFDDLGKDDHKKFKLKLCDRKQEPRIRRAKIEKTEDSLDLADLMITHFTSNGAVAVTLEILEAIACNEHAEELREKTKRSTPVAQPEEVDQKPAPSDLKTVDYLSDDCPEHFTPCSPTFKDKILKEKDKEIYKQLDKSKRKRLALVITNINFKMTSMKRSGAEKDEENMECLLRQLDYDVVKHRDLSGNQMDEAIKKFAQRDEHKNSDSTFVVIMSHGMLGVILGINYDKENNDLFPIDNIYKHLNSVNCPALLDKPKVILIQACRGEEHGRVWSDGVPQEPMGIEADDFVHKEKDFISLLSCTPETKSYRHVKFGTFYVRCILKVFRKVAHEDHIEELFRKVMRCFESDTRMGPYKQMVCKDRATLTKLFYLFPGL
ncbi:caspase a [Triplophysa rosa]|uniref:Caspase-1 n=1 Tax=Triplophysa rosa TaxID=992332 RepID=A0A9W7WRS1_TRIRA|nr:caspase a [Triplophysa rosa]KAI7807172.1 caspase-1 [Triplophysa rosa]